MNKYKFTAKLMSFNEDGTTRKTLELWGEGEGLTANCFKQQLKRDMFKKHGMYVVSITSRNIKVK